MPQTDTRSLQQIKRETEQTRAGLTDTVDQLRTSVAETASDIRQRIKPDAIKAEVSEYIKSRGERLLNDVTADTGLLNSFAGVMFPSKSNSSQRTHVGSRESLT